MILNYSSKKINQPKNVKCQPLTTTIESFMSVNNGCLRTLDSFRFLISGLDNLTKFSNEDALEIIKKFVELIMSYLKN